MKIVAALGIIFGAALAEAQFGGYSIIFKLFE
jgi:hypothetical protein